MYNSGSPTVANCAFIGNTAERNGGGMYNLSNSAVVTNCLFEGNRATGSNGGGILNYNTVAVTVTKCSFTGNSADKGGAIYTSGTQTITDCYFENNSAALGGGVENGGASGTITGCTFIGNKATSCGGAMYNAYGGSTTVKDCAFSANSAEYGGAVDNDKTHPAFINCTFAANNCTSGDGGAMWNGSASPVVVNCTFSENSAKRGGAMYNCKFGDPDSNPVIYNSILWANSADVDSEIGNDKYANSYATVKYSVVKDLNIGTRSISADITSEDPALGSRDMNYSDAAESGDIYVYEIESNSPARYLGLPVGTTVLGDIKVPANDQTGMMRKAAVSADAGAYSRTIDSKQTLVVTPGDANGSNISIGGGTYLMLKLNGASVLTDASWDIKPTDIASLDEQGAAAIVKGLNHGTATVTATPFHLGMRDGTTPTSVKYTLTINPEPTEPQPTSSGGGGCSAGFASLALLAAIPIICRKKKQ